MQTTHSTRLHSLSVDMEVRQTQNGAKRMSLNIFVIGASGDLASKKIYPSLFSLYGTKILPEKTTFWGYARSNNSQTQFRSKIMRDLLNHKDCSPTEQGVVEDFLSKCFYHNGKSYGDEMAYRQLITRIQDFETNTLNEPNYPCNRLFYFAIPPNVFAETGIALKNTCLSKKGWNRIIVEKPFGHNLESCIELTDTLSANFEEHQLYRIDHYLGKEMVQNILTLRFTNRWIKDFWQKNSIKSVLIEFKESIGTEGRGGYFDKYGIIRDIIQNHLLQILTLLAMECPIKGSESQEAIRDAKVRVLQSINPIEMNECVLGQYNGYNLDPSIEDKHSITATYAALCCYVNTPRWQGVPFVLTAGKALDEQKVEIRLTLKNEKVGLNNCSDNSCVRDNEFVIQLQPKPSISMQTNIKSPGYATKIIRKKIEMKYEKSFPFISSLPDAYTRLLLDALNGNHGSFVRNDELIRSWEIFSPLLGYIDQNKIQPSIYEKGSKAPKEAENFVSNRLSGISASHESNVKQYVRSSL